jgi:hypothetical protein
MNATGSAQKKKKPKSVIEENAEPKNVSVKSNIIGPGLIGYHFFWGFFWGWHF